MKNLIISMIFTMTSFSVFAASNKICFGMDDVKGTHFILKASKAKVEISKASRDDIEYLNGTHLYAATISGRDHVQRPAYSVDDLEGGTLLILDPGLLKSGTKGYAKARWQGEGYSQSAFFCKDNE